MILLSTIINKFKTRFFTRYNKSILPGHKKALYAMERCRTEHGPHMLARCINHDCEKQTYIPHSCGHRSCPHCQNHESQQWIENQLNKRLPATYFLITFTLPKQLRDLAWRNQKLLYSLMFLCVQELLKTFTKNDKKLQGTAGFTLILHTHSRRLDFHPHIHVVIPGASINKKTGLWQVKSSGYLFSHKAMANVFRAKLLQAIVDNDMRIPSNCPKKWVVDCKNVGNEILLDRESFFSCFLKSSMSFFLRTKERAKKSILCLAASDKSFRSLARRELRESFMPGMLIPF